MMLWNHFLYEVTIYGVMELYHASKEIVQYPEIRKAKYTKDFSWGFYCTNNMQQAIRCTVSR